MAAQRARGATASPRPAGPAGRAGGGDLTAHRNRLRLVIEPVVNSAGFDLEDLNLSRAGRRHVVRVVVDGDGGVSLDEIAEVSRALSTALDEAEETSGAFAMEAYQLEVSSPGVDRPLTLPRHWRRNVGRLVKVKAGDRVLTGRITAVDGENVVFDVDKATQEVPIGQLGPGRVQVEFVHVADADLGDEDSGEDEEVDEE
jgi:ribosome maturation factor RimP